MSRVERSAASGAGANRAAASFGDATRPGSVRGDKDLGAKRLWSQGKRAKCIAALVATTYFASWGAPAGEGAPQIAPAGSPPKTSPRDLAGVSAGTSSNNPANDPASVSASAATSAATDGALGVENPQRAWQHWTLNCQGCHRQDGTGSAGTAPSLAGTVARFLSVPGGREYLGRVPGVSTSPLSNADLSEVMNWMLWRFDKEHLPANFLPYTAAEIGQLRSQPLRLEASQMRAELLKRADGSATP